MCIVKLFGNRNQGPLNVTESKQTHFKYNIQCYSTSKFPIKLFYLIRKTDIRAISNQWIHFSENIFYLILGKQILRKMESTSGSCTLYIG